MNEELQESLPYFKRWAKFVLGVACWFAAYLLMVQYLIDLNSFSFRDGFIIAGQLGIMTYPAIQFRNWWLKNMTVYLND